jgi:biotin transport system substrate-specific component
MTAATCPARRGERIVLADLLPGSLVRDTVLVVGGAALTGLAAQVSIHTSLTPVPFTLQTLSVLVVGGALGAIRGVLSMLVYLLAGVAGVPWFASHASGWGGPTFGYVIGFVVAAGVVGALARRGNDRAVLSTIGLMALGNAVIYAIGATWLAHDLHLSAAKAIELGVTPFLLGDAAKIAVAALAFPAAWRLAGR